MNQDTELIIGIKLTKTRKEEKESTQDHAAESSNKALIKSRIDLQSFFIY